MATPEHANALKTAGADTATAAKVMDLMPQSGLSITQILDLARRVPWATVIKLMTDAAAKNIPALIADFIDIINSIQAPATATTKA